MSGIWIPYSRGSVMSDNYPVDGTGDDFLASLDSLIARTKVAQAASKDALAEALSHKVSHTPTERQHDLSSIEGTVPTEAQIEAVPARLREAAHKFIVNE